MPKAKEMKPGPVAQLGERCVRNAEVESSILFGSTIYSLASRKRYFYEAYRKP